MIGKHLPNAILIPCRFRSVGHRSLIAQLLGVTLFEDIHTLVQILAEHFRIVLDGQIPKDHPTIGDTLPYQQAHAAVQRVVFVVEKITEHFRVRLIDANDGVENGEHRVARFEEERGTANIRMRLGVTNRRAQFVHDIPRMSSNLLSSRVLRSHAVHHLPVRFESFVGISLRIDLRRRQRVRLIVSPHALEDDLDAIVFGVRVDVHQRCHAFVQIRYVRQITARVLDSIRPRVIDEKDGIVVVQRIEHGVGQRRHVVAMFGIEFLVEILVVVVDGTQLKVRATVEDLLGHFLVQPPIEMLRNAIERELQLVPLQKAFVAVVRRHVCVCVIYKESSDSIDRSENSQI